MLKIVIAKSVSFFFNTCNFIYSFLAVLGFPLVAESLGLLFVSVCGLLTVMASLVEEQGL